MLSPLADRMRPQCVSDMVGQKHLLGEGKALRRIIESGESVNLIFYGPSGTGKTTLASIIAKNTNRKFHKLNATTAGAADIKAVVAELGTLAAPNGILLYLDEIQYFNKKQQQMLLDYIEKGQIILIASTTENPYFYIYSALLSRCTVFEFKSVSAQDIVPAVERAVRFLEQDKQTEILPEDGVVEKIAYGCGSDVRKAISLVELAFLSSNAKDGKCVIKKETVDQLTQGKSMQYDKDGDNHYDILSAFQKSMRGSDVSAALHYLARLLEAGDMPSAMRRLMICACEDVGLAYPQIIPIVKAAVDAAQMVGLPEARIPLADAVTLVCLCPKSNSAYLAYDAAAADIRSGKSGPIPRQLQNKHFDGEDNQNKGQFYLYPHDFPNHYTPQQYLPDILKNASYYAPGENKTEQAYAKYWREIKKELK